MDFDDFDDDTQRQVVRLVMIDWARRDLAELGREHETPEAVLHGVARMLARVHGCPMEQLDDAAQVIQDMALKLAHKRGKGTTDAIWAMTNAIVNALDEPESENMKALAYRGARHAMECGIIRAMWTDDEAQTMH